MMLRVRTLPILVLTVLAAACGSSSSTTTPSGTGTNTGGGTTSTFTLSGTITSAAGGGIAGATVAVADGANAGKQATTDSSGNYSIANLTQSGFTVTITANGFVQQSKPVTVTGNTTLSVTLLPSAVFSVTGVGNNTITVPSYVTQLHIVGNYVLASGNFVVWVGPTGVDCDTVSNANCHQLVNTPMGIVVGKVNSDGVYSTSGQPSLQVVRSTGVSWTISEQR